MTLSETTEFLYKTTDYYSPQHERCIRWDDAAIGVAWPLTGAPTLSGKDVVGAMLSNAEARLNDQTLQRNDQVKKILVTGADGFIGSSLTEALVRQRVDVRAFVLYNSFNSWAGWIMRQPISSRRSTSLPATSEIRTGAYR